MFNCNKWLPALDLGLVFWNELFGAAQNKTGCKWTNKQCGASSSPFSSPIYRCRHLQSVLAMLLVRNRNWRWHLLPFDIFYTFYKIGEMRLSILLRKLCKMYCFISSNITLLEIQPGSGYVTRVQRPYELSKETLGCKKSNVDVWPYQILGSCIASFLKCTREKI